VALVLWGSDNIKSDGGPIGQALALMGAPALRQFGRLSGADLIPLAELGRPRIDVIMTLSGIFRDLLPLQTRLLAEAAYKAATADEPAERTSCAPCPEIRRGDGLRHGNRERCGSFRTPRAPMAQTSTSWSTARPLAPRTIWPTPMRRARALPMASTASRCARPRC
jgi:cobalamin biosynthesis Mg chelatase CobN